MVNAILADACVVLGIEVSDVLDWKEYPEYITVILVSGPKLTAQKADIQPKAPARRKRSPAKKKA